jgi:hypothetical protein
LRKALDRRSLTRLKSSIASTPKEKSATISSWRIWRSGRSHGPRGPPLFGFMWADLWVINPQAIPH